MMKSNFKSDREPSANSKIVALVLAGGKSSRMGRDKALLTIGNSTLLSHVCNVAQESVNCVYAIAPWVETYRSFVPSQVRLLSETITITDAESNCPLIGFYQGLQQIKSDAGWILLLACDLPNIQVSTIKKWCEYLPQVTAEQIALVPRSSKGYDPLCGFYRSSCLPLLAQYIAQGGRSFQGWLNQHPVAELPVSDRSVLFNCNTPQDWQEVNG